MGKSSSSLKKIKRSRDSSKRKKTKRNKSKKIRRLKDHSDDSELSGSDSSSYSSSDDDHRRKKRRSKVSRKRSRRRYSSTESDDDDRPLKKKKRSKKKKISSRKRRERDLSSNSTSSESCPASDSPSRSSGSESDRERGRLGKVKARKRSKDSEFDECWLVGDEVPRENNPRRLRSVIVIPDAYDNDEREEEMVHDHDAYRARRDGETAISYPRIGSDVGYDESGKDVRCETSKASSPDDLEAILKKRALENLKKFRGEAHRSGIGSKKVSSAAEEEEPLQIKHQNIEESQDHDLMEHQLHVSADGRDVESSRKILQGVDVVKESISALTGLASLQDQQPSDSAKVKVTSGISSCTPRRKLIRPVWGQERVNAASGKLATDCQNAETESTNGSTTEKKLPESRNANTTLNEQPSCTETEALDETREVSVPKFEHKTLDEIEEASQSEQKSIDETKDGSQYEQKTMTVMRGGEMVQVSYKVYIPKKTSALGRRQLRR